jgi:hypothetical protein
VWAESKEDVEAAFDARVVDGPPEWLNGAASGVPSIDVDGSPTNLLPRRLS